MRLASSILLAALVLAGCDNPITASSDLVTARGSDNTLQITNSTSEPVYYFAADVNTLALLDWALCLDPSKCTHVEAHETVTIPYSQIIGKAGRGGRVVVYNWRLIAVGGGKYNADSVRSLRVNLQ